jgi:glycerol uptake facilitator-like aquaporin
MATKKAASTKKTTANKPASKPAKTTVRTVSASAKPTAKVEKTEVKTVARPIAAERKSQALPGNIVNIVFAELFGTFGLVLVALFAAKETGALYVGLFLAVMVMAIGAVSGSHLNPAVTLAKWTMRQLKSVLLPFYWGAQFLGAMLAVIVINWTTNNSLHLDFSALGSMNWAIFAVELVGAAIFMFGFAAATNRRTLSPSGVAIGAGLSLTVGLVVATSLLANVQGTVDTSQITSIDKVPHELRVKGATLNPAVALAATEQSDSGFTGTRADENEKQISRLSLEVLLGSLIGAVVGGNLYLMIAGSRRDQ